jgi:hypothetical protein
VASTDDRFDTLVAHLHGFLDFCQADLARYQLLFTRVIPGWEPSADAYAAALAFYARFTDAVAAIGLTRAADVDLLTAVTAGLAAQQAANDPQGDRYRALVPAAARMILHHCDTSPAPRPADPEEEP